MEIHFCLKIVHFTVLLRCATINLMKEKTISSQTIFSGKLLKIKQVQVQQPAGKTAVREIIYHPGAAAVIPVLPGNRIVLIKQYRKAAEQIMLEIPAGTLEPGETPARCARRELTEETGYQAGTLQKLMVFYPTPGYSTEKIYVFKAGQLKKRKLQWAADEFIETVIMAKDEIKQLFRQGKINDAKTLAALLYLNFI